MRLVRLGKKTSRARQWFFGTVALGTFAIAPAMADGPFGFPFSSDWPMFGQNTANTGSNSTGITAANASTLKPKWTFTTGADVSARAAVVAGVAYFPDWAGNLFAVDATHGTKIWSHKLSDYGLTAGTVARTSPTVSTGILYIGTQYVAPANTSGPQPPTGWLLAINAANGNLIWKMQPTTSNAFPVITGSPVVAFGIVYVPMTSNEEFAAAAGSTYYKCCSVSGSIVAVDAFFGFKLWETFTVPKGYSGGAVWGSNPVVDLERGLVYVGTGNNYSVPTDPAYVACISKAGGSRASCESPDDHADSIVALDMWNGKIKWATRLENWNQPGITNGSDFWNVDCVFGGPGNCPSSPGPDYDFGSAPNEITYNTNHGPKTIIGAGQKSGIYYALDPDTGALLWQTQVGPGSSLGGMEWGSATDGTRIYVQITNLYGLPYSVASLGSAGSWAALDPATGKILWQVADPNKGIDLGPMAVANGVVFAPSMGAPPTCPTCSPGLTSPNMFALDASSGKTLWSFTPGRSVNAGAVVVDNSVYWGSGYVHLAPALGSGSVTTGTFYAFSLPGGDQD